MRQIKCIVFLLGADADVDWILVIMTLRLGIRAMPITSSSFIYFRACLKVVYVVLNLRNLFISQRLIGMLFFKWVARMVGGELSVNIYTLFVVYLVRKNRTSEQRSVRVCFDLILLRNLGCLCCSRLIDLVWFILRNTCV